MPYLLPLRYLFVYRISIPNLIYLTFAHWGPMISDQTKIMTGLLNDYILPYVTPELFFEIWTMPK